MVDVEAVIELTSQLVAIESPPDHQDGIAAVVAELSLALAAFGIESTTRDVDGAGPLLDAEASIPRPGEIVILGHADTIWPTGTIRSWPFARDERHLYGPGVGDMKVCLATAVHVLGSTATSAGPGRARLLVVPDEERGSTASRPVIEEALRGADACVVLEAARPGFGLVTSRGAVGAMTVRATGQARHTTDVGPRASALAPLAALVGAIEALDGASVGVMRAGTARQVVPGEALLEVDLRAATTADLEVLAAAVRNLVADVPAVPGVAVSVTGGLTRPAWPRGDASLFGQARAVAAAVGVELHEVAERGGSDASFPGALGIPTLDGVGPICHDSCSRAERVEISSIAPLAAIFASLLGAGPVGV